MIHGSGRHLRPSTNEEWGDAGSMVGLGEAAEGSTCSISDQTKEIAQVLDRGVFVGIMVNEPSSPIEPADVGRAIEGVFAQLDGSA